MAKKVTFVITTLILIYLTKAFYYQKWLGYETIPETGIADEHDYPVAGYTFRHTGIPTGWSNMDVYKILDDQNPNPPTGYENLSITSNGKSPSISNIQQFNYPLTRAIDVNIGNGQETIRIVQPFLDHPPLGSLIYSLNVTDPKHFDDITIPQIRSISLTVSSITAILIFAYSYLIYRKLIISFLAFIIYSTVSTYILISRFALFENLIIPFYLLSHIFLIIGLKIKKNSLLFIILAGFVIGLTYLVKEIGLFCLASSLILLVYHHRKLKTMIIHILFALLPILAYYSYSYYLAPELTLKLLLDQSHRGFFGPLNFLYSIYQPRVKDFPLEGYWLWGFLSIVYLSYKNFKKHQFLLIGFFSFLFFYLAFAGLNYPWYSFPFAPFFVIASAYLAYKLITQPNLFNSIFFFVFPFSSSFYWGYIAYHPKENLVNLYRIFLLFFIIFPFFIQTIIPRKPFFRIIYSLIITLILYQVYRWNFKSLIFIISNWKNLPAQFTL